MATNWPYGVDVFTTKVDRQDLVMAAHVNDLQDSVEAIETEIARTYRPDLKPAAPSAYDDEFETGALDAKWTAINCAPGAVNLLATGNVDVYDPSTFPGMMALQPGSDFGGVAGPEAEAAMLRQTVALAANCKIVAKMDVSVALESAIWLAPMPSGFGILLSGAAGFLDNDWIQVAPCPIARPGAIEGGNTVVGVHRIGGGAPVNLIAVGIMAPRYVMLMKTGNDVSAWGSTDGASWVPMVDAAAPDNVQFTFGAGVLVRLSLIAYWAPTVGEVNLPSPIISFDFVRYFENNTPLVNA